MSWEQGTLMRGGRRRVVERECGSREVCPWGRQTQSGGALPFRSILVKGKVLLTTG